MNHRNPSPHNLFDLLLSKPRNFSPSLLKFLPGAMELLVLPREQIKEEQVLEWAPRGSSNRAGD